MRRTPLIPLMQRAAPIASSVVVALLAVQAVPARASAQVNESAPASTELAIDTTPPLAEVIVSGEQPGPGLWKVTHGGTNVVWVLGTVGGIPKDLKWRSRQVEDVIAHAKAVIFGENVSPNIGVFRGLLLIPTVLKARFNPDKAVLKDIIPPEQYERWLVARKKYFKDDDDIERIRPMFIGMGLSQAAGKNAGLDPQMSAGRIVAMAAKKSHVPIQTPEVKIDLPNPKQAIHDFTETPRTKDLECFNAAFDNVDSDVEKLKARAAAWAVGDIEAFHKLPAPVAERVCLDSLTSAPALQGLFTKMKAQVVDTWLWEVTKALELNDVTLVVISLDDVLSPTGRLERLRERGYTIEAP
jgi:uncharacterized protein YbaP (TraB family)